ncbi:uncharacterized protein EV420DRAFT_1547136 [Desarmillaria tabescens]|uniref:MYND-type domain-containing protein n=1 Tax=Armillaria tabescens TaxID=1929756 RepID=A0AA39KAT6_ARMTA|nr:uncharacterized protein EV420DRAFT_1547136 [Desarmillaria tabescens]KAK0457746.1 hypothetical protein EV420DRAFT_1547136 [Desarmillaria tabescens]
MAILGRPLFLQLDLLFFPGPNKSNNYIMFEKGDELAAKLQEMRYAHLPNVRRHCTHPCTITNNANAKSLTLQPLIGTADDGLYMRRSDAEKLGLEFTGREIDTRQGKCKVYKGASYRFQNDYNGGAVTYHAPHVLVLESWVTKTLHANASTNAKKEGIVGVPQLDRHLVFFHHGDVHMIDLSVLPPLAEYFTNLTPLANLIPAVDRGNTEDETPQGTQSMTEEPPVDFATCLSIAQRFRAKKFDVFRHVPQDYVVNVIEQCRTCKKNEDRKTRCKLSMCTLCKEENRSRRALYCSQECQTMDWKARHKEEHSGARPWEDESTL